MSEEKSKKRKRKSKIVLPSDYDELLKHLPENCFSTVAWKASEARAKVCPGYADNPDGYERKKVWTQFLNDERARKMGIATVKEVKGKRYAAEKGTYLEFLLKKEDKSDNDLKKIELLKDFKFGTGPTKDFKFKTTSNVHLIDSCNNFIIASSGGTNSSKTCGNLQRVIKTCRYNKLEKFYGIGSRSQPHLNRGVIPDFKQILRDWKIYDHKEWRQQAGTYTFPNGSTVMFVPLDDPDKYAGPRWDGFFINEANRGINYETVRHIVARTNNEFLLDWNPTGPFWFHTRMLKDPKLKIDYLDELNYLGNETLTEEQNQAMDMYRQDEYNFNVYILGKPGDADDVIFQGIKVLEPDPENPEPIPEDAILLGYGLDFGGAGSKTSAMALVSIWQWGHSYIINEELYDYDIATPQVGAHLLAKRRQRPVVCDYNNLEGIRTLKDMGIPAQKAIKGPGSWEESVSFVKSLSVFITATSTNLIAEKDAYVWKRDNTDETLNEPAPKCSDHALDAMRYGYS